MISWILASIFGWVLHYLLHLSGYETMTLICLFAIHLNTVGRK